MPGTAFVWSHNVRQSSRHTPCAVTLGEFDVGQAEKRRHTECACYFEL